MNILQVQFNNTSMDLVRIFAAEGNTIIVQRSTSKF